MTKKEIKRSLSLILALVMLLSGFSSYAPLIAEAVSISHEDKTTTLDLLTEVVSANLSPYGITTDSAKVKDALIAVGSEKGLAAITDTDSGITPPDQITTVYIYDVIQKLVTDYNNEVTTAGMDTADRKSVV